MNATPDARFSGLEGGDYEKLADTMRMKIKDSGSFSETIEIRKDGSLAVAETVDSIKSLFANLAWEGIEDLYELAKRVQQIDSGLKFAFEQDPEGKWIRYTVTTI